jgi:hypothetical protein
MSTSTLGAYSSDHADRSCLVPISRACLEVRFGHNISPTHIVVVGDTPRDVAAVVKAVHGFAAAVH